MSTVHCPQSTLSPKRFETSGAYIRHPRPIPLVPPPNYPHHNPCDQSLGPVNFFPLPFCGDPKNRPSLVSIAFACKPKPASGRAFLVPISQPAAAAAAAAALFRATGQSSSRSAAKRLSVCSGDIDASKTQSNRRTLPDSRRHSRPHLGPLQTTVSIFSFLVRPPLHASPRISSPPSTARARARARLLADDCQSPVTTPRVAQVDTAWTSPSCQPSPLRLLPTSQGAAPEHVSEHDAISSLFVPVRRPRLLDAPSTSPQPLNNHHHGASQRSFQ